MRKSLFFLLQTSLFIFLFGLYVTPTQVTAQVALPEVEYNLNLSPSCFRSAQRVYNKLVRMKATAPYFTELTPAACQRLLENESLEFLLPRCDVIWTKEAFRGFDEADDVVEYLSAAVIQPICATAKGTSESFPDNYNRNPLFDTPANTANMYNSLKCGFADKPVRRNEQGEIIDTGANQCCTREDLAALDTDAIFESIPHECLIAGEVCVDDIAYLFMGETVTKITQEKQAQANTLIAAQKKFSAECIIGTPARNDGGISAEDRKNLGPDSTADCMCKPVENEAEETCKEYYNSEEDGYAACVNCLKPNYVNDTEDPQSDANLIKRANVYTAIGCVNASPSGILSYVFSIGIGIAGGVALLCIIYCAYIIQTSQANPERLNQARELLTSCITGLIIIIFSIFILRVIGVDILRIPGFSV